MPKDTDAFKSFPEGLESILSTYLTAKDLSALARASKNNHRLFKPMLDVAQLLQHVVRGEQEAAEALLRRQPGLLTKKGHVTDYSGRTFHDVSAWQCMLWAMDTRYMGQMMLSCVPAGESGDAIRRELLKQSEAMQAGGRDVVKMSDNPSTLSIDELKTYLTNHRADNQDILLCHWDSARDTGTLYYYTNDTVVLLKYEPTDANEAFMALFRLMDMDSAKKSNDAEHALITRATGKTLSRSGIHYEQPATYKSLVKLGGTMNPGDIPFADIGRLFDTPDALLFWNNQFYYANKADVTVTLITPTDDLSPEEITAVDALKTSLTGMEANKSRRPSTLNEHQLINTLFREHPAFKPTHHCESHYDFGIIDALQTYVDRFDTLDWEPRDALWINIVAKIQRLAPAHILQHYCDPDTPFYPAPNFKADEFKREGPFYNYISNKWFNLFSARGLDADFGFQFGLSRRVRVGSRGARAGAGPRDVGWAGWDLSALRGLCEVRTGDARLLQDRLHQLLVPAPVGPTGAAGGPS